MSNPIAKVLYVLFQLVFGLALWPIGLFGWGLMKFLRVTPKEVTKISDEVVKKIEERAKK